MTTTLGLDPVIRYARQPVAPWQRMPRYADWLRAAMRPRPLGKARALRIPHQSPHGLAGYDRDFNTLNNLKATPIVGFSTFEEQES